MDHLRGNTVINPSGLDATVFGSPSLLPRGIKRQALRLEIPRQYLRVAGPGHRYECLGDLERCQTGRKD